LLVCYLPFRSPAPAKLARGGQPWVKAGRIEFPLKAKHALAQVMMGAAAAQRFTFLDSL
jgi:hypothetical protein